MVRRPGSLSGGAHEGGYTGEADEGAGHVVTIGPEAVKGHALQQEPGHADTSVSRQDPAEAGVGLQRSDEAVEAERDDAGPDPQPAAVLSDSLPHQPGASDLGHGGDEQGDAAQGVHTVTLEARDLAWGRPRSGVLHRGAPLGGVGAEDATVTRARAKTRAAASAGVEVGAGVDGHCLFTGGPAVRASDGRLEHRGHRTRLERGQSCLQKIATHRPHRRQMNAASPSW